MKRFEKLKQNWEFQRTYKRGKTFVSPFFVLYVVQNKKQSIRLGITAGKKIGGAVKRNRAKRVITAAFSNLRPIIQEGYDFVVVARVRILGAKSTQVEAVMKEQLKCAGLLKE